MPKNFYKAPNAPMQRVGWPLWGEIGGTKTTHTIWIT